MLLTVLCTCRLLQSQVISVKIKTQGKVLHYVRFGHVESLCISGILSVYSIHSQETVTFEHLSPQPTTRNGDLHRQTESVRSRKTPPQMPRTPQPVLYPPEVLLDQSDAWISVSPKTEKN